MEVMEEQGGREKKRAKSLGGVRGSDERLGRQGRKDREEEQGGEDKEGAAEGADWVQT